MGWRKRKRERKARKRQRRYTSNVVIEFVPSGTRSEIGSRMTLSSGCKAREDRDYQYAQRIAYARRENIKTLGFFGRLFFGAINR